MRQLSFIDQGVFIVIRVELRAATFCRRGGKLSASTRASCRRWFHHLVVSLVAAEIRQSGNTALLLLLLLRCILSPIYRILLLCRRQQRDELTPRDTPLALESPGCILAT